MKNLNIKTILLIAFLSIFVSSCTDLDSDDERLLNNNDNIENVQATDGTNPNNCTGKDC